MTAGKRGSGSVIRIERVAKNEVNYGEVFHVAGGPLKGIVINRAKTGEKLFRLLTILLYMIFCTSVEGTMSVILHVLTWHDWVHAL